MQKRKLSRILDVEPAACILLAVAVLFIPLRWVISWLAAATVHELCHYAMIILTGGDVYKVHIGTGGAIMQTRLRSQGREVLCAAAGPLGGFLLLLSARWAPRLALCGVIQSLWNLIPIVPFDGGRVLAGLLRRLFPRCAAGIIRWTENITLLGIFIACICGGVFFKLGLLPLIFAVSVLLHSGKIKIPCKDGRLRVQ